jgi:hypothetical protein
MMDELIHIKYGSKCPRTGKVLGPDGCRACSFYRKIDEWDITVGCSFGAKRNVDGRVKRYVKEIMRLRRRVSYYKGRQDGYNFTINKLLKRNAALSGKIGYLLKEKKDAAKALREENPHIKEYMNHERQLREDG